MESTCSHLDQVTDVTPSSTGCIDCLAIGGQWVHLRMCRACGHVGCCDQSPNRHGTKHFNESAHAVMSSFEPGEGWFFCYVDDFMFELDGVATPNYETMI